MMEEVNDDANGESTFEFVGGKGEEISSKFVPASSMSMSLPAVSGTVGQSPLNVTSASLQEQYFVPMQKPTFMPAIPNEPSPITFYDPALHTDSSTVLLPPLTNPPPVTQNLSWQNEFSSSQTTFAPSDPTPLAQQIPMHTQPEYGNTSQISHSALAIPGDTSTQPLDPNLSHHDLQEQSGMWGWLKGKSFLNKVAEKAKHSVDSVITTLDPGMKEIINTGGDITVIVASGNETKISAVREAFQHVFGKATVHGITVQSSSIAPQPVGYSAGLKAAEERISNLRQHANINEQHIFVAIENFLAELTPENWFDIGCLLLQDTRRDVILQVYTEAIPVSSHYIVKAKEQTPSNYPLIWSGFAMTIGQILGDELGIDRSEWQQALTSVSRRERLLISAKTLAGLYKIHTGR